MKKIKEIYGNITKSITSLPKGSITNIIIGLALFISGIFCLIYAFTTNFENTNATEIPDNPREGYFTIFTVEGEEISKLDFKPLVKDLGIDYKPADSQTVATFAINTNPSGKIKEFIDKNKGVNYLGMRSGKPPFDLNIVSVEAKKYNVGGKDAKYDNGKAYLFKGYENFNDAEAGVNKKHFALYADKIVILENGKTIDTSVGKIELKQGDN